MAFSSVSSLTLNFKARLWSFLLNHVQSEKQKYQFPLCNCFHCLVEVTINLSVETPTAFLSPGPRTGCSFTAALSDYISTKQIPFTALQPPLCNLHIPTLALWEMNRKLGILKTEACGVLLCAVPQPISFSFMLFPCYLNGNVRSTFRIRAMNLISLLRVMSAAEGLIHETLLAQEGTLQEGRLWHFCCILPTSGVFPCSLTWKAKQRHNVKSSNDRLLMTTMLHAEHRGNTCREYLNSQPNVSDSGWCITLVNKELDRETRVASPRYRKMTNHCTHLTPRSRRSLHLEMLATLQIPSFTSLLPTSNQSVAALRNCCWQWGGHTNGLVKPQEV